MYFRNNGISKNLPQDTKPTPFPRTLTAEQTQATSSSVNTLNRNCHEFVNDGHGLQPMSAINLGSSNASFFSEDETEEMDNGEFSDDLQQRLIL